MPVTHADVATPFVLAAQRFFERARLCLGLAQDGRGAADLFVDRPRRRRPPPRQKARQRAANEAGHAQDRGIAEQIAQEGLHRFQRIRSAEIEQDDGDLHEVDGFQLRTISTSCATCSGGVCGTHAMAQVEHEGTMAELVEDARGLALQRRTACHQHQRIEIALQADMRLQFARRPMSTDAGIDRQGSKGIISAIHQGCRTDGARKGDDRRLGMARVHGMGDAHHRLERPARSSCSSGSTPAQESKSCTASAPASIWLTRWSTTASTRRSISSPRNSGWR